MDVMKKKSTKELTSQDGSDERPPSPYDCAICLEQLTDKSFTNSCLHTFCFHCLLAWSKVKPECPLCKQDFCSIFHNIRSIDDFDEYHVPPSEARLRLTPPFINTNNNHAADVFGATGHDFFNNDRRFFAYRTTAVPSGFTIPRERSPNLVIQPYVDNLEFQNDFSRTNSSHPLYSRSNRREIYLKELETLPPPTGGRYRECSPEFYRENEGQLHRLARWLHRELVALSQIGVRFVHHELQHLIMDLLRIYNINSDIFHNIVNRYLGAHTSRFIREFYNFATSPFEMEQYDRECVYVRQRTGSHLSFIVTVGRDDTEDVQVIPSTSLDQPVRPWIDVNDLNTTHYHVTGSGIQISARLHRNAFQRTNRLTTSSNTAISSHSVINISDSENDDCVIIDEVRTTPETIVLDDSDRENQIHASTTPILLSSRTCNSPEPNSVPLDLSTTRSPSSPVSVLDIQIIPSTSRHLPYSVDSSASCTSDVTNNISKREEEIKHVEVKTNKIKYRKRSSSATSSVLSTDLSSDGQNKFSIKTKRRKTRKYLKTKNPKRSGISRRRKKSSGVDFTIFSSDSSSVESDKNDLDWEQTRYKRKKKVKKEYADKHEKKSNPKKRKKAISQRKSQKKKKMLVSASDSCDSVDNNDNCEKKMKSYKKKLGGALNLNHQCVKLCHIQRETAELLPRSSVPKLRSIVKKVNNRVGTLGNGLNRHSNYYNTRNSSDYENINDLPSTSYGFISYVDNRTRPINYFDSSYSSDSD